MQGRITKVLNMKPPEILGLLEEAAGTKMYETKKQAALRTLEKKQLKVDEINKVLSEDIMPALDKLRREKVQYMEWQNASSKMERLQRFCVAYKYTEAKELLQDGETEVKQATDALSQYESQLEDAEEQSKRKKTDLKSIQDEKESQAGGEVKSLIQQTDALSKKLVQENSRLSNLKDALQSENDQRNLLCKSMEELNEEAIKERIRAATEKRDEAAAEVERSIQSVAAAQSELAGAEAGDGRDASNRSLQERLDDAKNSITEVDGTEKASKTAVKHQKKKLSELKKELSSKEKNGSMIQKEFEQEQNNLESLREKLNSFNYDENKTQSIENEIENERTCICEINDKIDQLSSKVAAAEFHFKDPVKGFDRSKVKGVVSKLVRVQDPKYSSALEVAAGGKLYQVIVDNEQTAKQLLAGGQLRNRVTIIPLNKVSARSLSESSKATARSLAGDKAIPALELVGYNQELESAMKYAFGGSFVCDDSSTARMLAFHKDIASRCVTLDGDDFNPSGTLTGGSRNKTNSILSQLHDLSELETELAMHEKKMNNLRSKIKVLNLEKSNFNNVKKDIEIKEHSVELLQKRLEGSEVHQLLQSVSACEKELEESEKAVADAIEKKSDLQELVRTLDDQIKNFDKVKNKLVTEAQKKLQIAKDNVETAKKHAREMEVSLQGVLADSESAAQERRAIQEQIDQSSKQIEKLEKDVREMTDLVNNLEAEHKSLSDTLAEKQSRLRQCDEEIAQIEREITEIESHKTDIVVEKKKLGNRIEALRKGAHTAEDKCRALEREYPWIQTEMSHFGTSGSDYDWDANDPTEMFQEYEKARGVIDNLSKRVNKKVMQMFEKAEHEYTELKRKKDVVEADKAKIRDVMYDLDEKKKEALGTTWKKVNEDLGSIFSTLLPGTMAKLEPVEGTSFMEGLEVKVAFGGVWKESLSELSGGQKSLLALSLILAMLLFKPAPIYILDEVDAALDLSHTQNIGRMIKSHFPQSQFIVVSLKEGMFSNANVIFRTKFVDGVSTVTRTVNNGLESSKSNRQQRAPLRENVRT
eukprot:jgi/Picre1/30538/NNA_005901.t1